MRISFKGFENHLRVCAREFHDVELLELEVVVSDANQARICQNVDGNTAVRASKIDRVLLVDEISNLQIPACSQRDTKTWLDHMMHSATRSSSTSSMSFTTRLISLHGSNCCEP